MNRLLVSFLSLLLTAPAVVAQSTGPTAVRGAVMPGSGAGPAITETQRVLLDEKIALINRIMQVSGAENVGPQVTAAQQRWMLESLYARSVTELRTMTPSADLNATIDAIQQKNLQGGKPVAKLGQNNTELVYYPIAPCRFIDTRNVGGKLANDVPRGFDLDLTGSAYGGAAACDPSSVVGGNANVIGAIALNVTIVDTTAVPGFMGARPFGSTNSTSMVNWYEAGPTVQAANAGIVTTNQATTGNEIEFFGTTTHLIVDIFGVFAAPTATALDCVTGTLTAIVNSNAPTFNLAATACPANYRMMSNSCQVTGDAVNVRLSAHGVISQNSANCQGSYGGAGLYSIANTPWCCRIPGR